MINGALNWIGLASILILATLSGVGLVRIGAGLVQLLAH